MDGMDGMDGVDGQPREDALVFRAGPGEWYNQPHDQIWDMGEDAQPLPPASWHAALESAILDQAPRPRRVVVDVREMAWLVGQDWGFLLALARETRGDDARLVVVADARVRKVAVLFGLGELMQTSPTVEDALRTAGDDA